MEMTENKENKHGLKCTCDHSDKQHHKKLNTVVENTENEKGYLTNDEWRDKYLHVRGFIDEWLPAECRECNCKQDTPIKRKWEFWK